MFATIKQRKKAVFRSCYWFKMKDDGLRSDATDGDNNTGCNKRGWYYQLQYNGGDNTSCDK